MYTRHRSQSGGILLRVVMIVCTLSLVGLAIVLALHTQEDSRETAYRRALQAAEFGLQKALTRISADPSWREGIAPTKWKQGAFQVKINLHEGTTPARMTITSQGRFGKVTREVARTLELSVKKSDSLWVKQPSR